MDDHRTAVYLNGALEPVYLNEPMQLTQMNMSAAMRNGMSFFQGSDCDGHDVVLAIGAVIYMRNEDNGS